MTRAGVVSLNAVKVSKSCLCAPTGSSLKAAVHMAAALPQLLHPPALLHFSQ